MVIIKNYKVKKIILQISGKIGINFRKFSAGNFRKFSELITLVVLHSSGELWQWLLLDDNAINITVVIVTVSIIIITFYIKMFLHSGTMCFRWLSAQINRLSSSVSSPSNLTLLSHKLTQWLAVLQVSAPVWLVLLQVDAVSSSTAGKRTCLTCLTTGWCSE